MSRGVEGRQAVWEAWLELHTTSDGHRPTAYAHQCGALGDLLGRHDSLHDVVCPGCRFELSHPERECAPLYRLPPP